MMCALQIIAKAAAAALLVATSSTWLMCYIAVDHGLHFLYKVSRRDIVIFIPMPTASSYILSVVTRVVWKTISDFTATPLFRLPLLNGGAYWLFNLAMSQVSVFACVYLYSEYAERPSDEVDKIEARVLWAGAAGLAMAWLLTFTYFVYGVAVPKYRHTLWSRTSGRQCVHDNFLKGEGDEGKFDIFRRNLLLWESEIGDQVKAWTAENWARWKEEKPAWFKPERVPDQFVPADELEQLGHNRKRRGSAAGSVRESIREAGEGGGE
jgi:hypothetical protein